MKNCWVPALTVVALCSGCTTMSLERYTLSQIESSRDYRTNEVLDCLATVAADPDNLPSFALLADGVTNVTDMGTVSSMTTWARPLLTFAPEALAFTASHSPQGQWTVEPVADFDRLEAMRCACQWAISGPDGACPECAAILGDAEGASVAEEGPAKGAHFGVAERLARMPAGWLHVGRLTDVPPRAAYKAHSGSTWVWVLPEGAEGLADFTLVLHDIATLDPSAYRAPLLVTLTREEVTNIKDFADPDKKFAVVRSEEIRAIKPEFKDKIQTRIQEGLKRGEVDISWAEWMNYTIPFRGTRTNVNPTVAVGTPSLEAVPSRPNTVAPGAVTPTRPTPKKTDGGNQQPPVKGKD